MGGVESRLWQLVYAVLSYGPHLGLIVSLSSTRGVGLLHSQLQGSTSRLPSFKQSPGGEGCNRQQRAGSGSLTCAAGVAGCIFSAALWPEVSGVTKVKAQTAGAVVILTAVVVIVHIVPKIMLLRAGVSRFL